MSDFAQEKSFFLGASEGVAFRSVFVCAICPDHARQRLRAAEQVDFTRYLLLLIAEAGDVRDAAIVGVVLEGAVSLKMTKHRASFISREKGHGEATGPSCAGA
jgi:hypothetical protein